MASRSFLILFGNFLQEREDDDSDDETCDQKYDKYDEYYDDLIG